MECFKFEKLFSQKEELIRYGEAELRKQIFDNIDKIESHYILRPTGMAKEMYKLLGFSSYEEVKEKLNNKPVFEIKEYLGKFISNIFESLKDEYSFISECFYDRFYRRHRDFQIQFEITDNSLKISIMSLKNGSGSGHSFSFDLINSVELEKLRKRIIELDYTQSIKDKYLEIINIESYYYVDFEQVVNEVKEAVVDRINDFIHEYEKEFKCYKTLKKNEFDNKLLIYLSENTWIKDILDAITIEYEEKTATHYDVIMDKVKCKEGELYTDENSIIIRLNKEIIKCVTKWSYTSYQLDCK